MISIFKQTFKPHTIIFIDDEESIREEVAKLSNPSCTIQVFPGLTSVFGRDGCTHPLSFDQRKKETGIQKMGAYGSATRPTLYKHEPRGEAELADAGPLWLCQSGTASAAKNN
jgi:hypothetical protein